MFKFKFKYLITLFLVFVICKSLCNFVNYKINLIINSKDNLIKLLKINNLNLPNKKNVFKLISNLNNLKPKEKLKIYFNKKNKILRIIYINNNEFFDINFERNSIEKYKKNELLKKEVIVGKVNNYGKINNKKLSYQQSHIINNFLLNYKKEKNFKNSKYILIVENYYLRNQKIFDGIVSAIRIYGSKNFDVINYRIPKKRFLRHFYSLKGKNLEKIIFSFPLKNKKVSSNFNLKRFHPILHKIIPHRGIDLVAKIGTLVKSSAKGYVVYKGKKNGYGNIVILKHDKNCFTYYAHLLKFNNKIKIGDYIESQKLIGYTGKSGLASGPHLHYEIRINNIPLNPMKIKNFPYNNIDEEEKKKFSKYANKIKKIFDLHKK